MPPLAADMTFVVEGFEEENPQIFGEAGAYGQVFALATTLGPLCAGFLEASFGWPTMSLILGIFGASGAIPTVCSSVFTTEE